MTAIMKALSTFLFLCLVGLNSLMAADSGRDAPSGKNLVPPHKTLEHLIKLANEQIEAGDKQAIHTTDSATRFTLNLKKPGF